MNTVDRAAQGRSVCSGLRALLYLFVALQLLGIVVGPVLSAGQERIPQWCRLPGSAILVVCSALIWRSAVGPMRRCCGLICGGMLFGHLGDLAMGRILPTPEPWLAGMALFGVGHVFYTAAFLLAAQQRASAGELPWRSSVVAVTLVSFGTLGAMLPGTEAPLALRLGGIGYAAVISVMTGLALALGRAARAFRALALGAFLFWLSDLMLGASLYTSVGGSLWNDIIWVEYIAGQALIVTGAKTGVRPVCMLAETHS